MRRAKILSRLAFLTRGVRRALRREPARHAGAGATRAHAAARDGGPVRSRRGSAAVRREPERDRVAEREDRRLRQEAGVARRRRGVPRAGDAAGERSAAGVRARGRDRAVPAAAAPRVTVHRRVLGGLALLSTALLFFASGVAATERLSVSWHPSKPRVGDAALLQLRGAPEGATVEGAVDGHLLVFFPYAGGHAALVGFDLEVKPGPKPWHLAVLESAREPRTVRGTVRVLSREFPVQRLSLPPGMVDLDPETE